MDYVSIVPFYTRAVYNTSHTPTNTLKVTDPAHQEQSGVSRRKCVLDDDLVFLFFHPESIPSLRLRAGHHD